MVHYPPGTGCLCWSARNCLMLWTGISIGLVGLGVILSFATGEWSFSDGNTVVSFVTAVISIGVNLFGFLAAALKNRRMLQISFFLVIFNIAISIVGCILSILVVTGVIGDYIYSSKGAAIAFVICFYAVVIVVQGLLGWTVRRCIKEIELDVYNLPTHNPYVM